MLGWPLRMRWVSRVHASCRRGTQILTMMSTSFLTSESIASFGTAIRLRT